METKIENLNENENVKDKDKEKERDKEVNLKEEENLQVFDLVHHAVLDDIAE